MISLIVTILLGALTGWCAGKIMKCEGSWLRNIILGLVGGAVSGFIFKDNGQIIGFVLSVLVSCGLIWLAKKIFK